MEHSKTVNWEEKEIGANINAKYYCKYIEFIFNKKEKIAYYARKYEKSQNHCQLRHI